MEQSFKQAIRDNNVRLEGIAEVVDCFHTLAFNLERLNSECIDLKRRCDEKDMHIRTIQSELSFLKRDASPDANAKRFVELEAKYGALNDERAELYKAASVNTMKLLELSEHLKQRDLRIVELNDRERASLKEKEKLMMKIDDLDALLREKNFTIQILQDELTALQLELIRMDEETKDRPEDLNGRLLRRVSIGGVPIGTAVGVCEPVQLQDEESEYSITEVPVVGSRTIPYKCAAACATLNIMILSTGKDTFPVDQKWTFQCKSNVQEILVNEKICLLRRQDGVITILNTTTGQVRGQLTSPDVADFKDICFDDNGDEGHVWTLSPGALKYWHCDRSICLRTVVVDPKVLCMASSGGTVYIGTEDGRVYSFDNQEGLKVFYTARSKCRSIAVLRNSNGLLLVAFSNTAVLFQSGKPVQTFEGEDISFAGFHQDDDVYICSNSLVTFYRLSGFKQEQTLQLPSKIVAFGRNLIVCQTGVYKVI